MLQMLNVSRNYFPFVSKNLFYFLDLWVNDFTCITFVGDTQLPFSALFYFNSLLLKLRKKKLRKKLREKIEEKNEKKFQKKLRKMINYER